MRALERSIKGHLEVILNLFRSIVVAYFLYQTCTIFMVHWYILLIYIINVPYFYGTSANERSATRSRDLNRPITGKYYSKFHHA